jgi:menaquinol-cytochrome c reductase iron-sulfur subunit
MGFAIGISVLLVGLVFSWWIAAVGAVITLGAGLGWASTIKLGATPAPVSDGAPGEPEADGMPPDERYSRNAFLEISTLGLGAVIGGLIMVPALGFMVLPPFLKQGFKDIDLGPMSDFPEGEFVVATFMRDETIGQVSRMTAFVRNNGFLGDLPSFTILSNHCAHLGCPVQPAAKLEEDKKKEVGNVTLIPTSPPSGFGCPCHGGQYDLEGNRVAGPPVRALDRYSFSIRNGRLFLGSPFSVSHVAKTGADAQIHKWTLAYPGEPVSGLESWMYPIQPPH